MARNVAAVLGAGLLLAGGGSFLIFGFETATRLILAAGILLVGIAVAIEPDAVVGKAKTRTAMYGGNTVLLAIVVIGILAAINVLGARRHERWDLTSNKQFSLSDATAKLLGDLQKPIQVTAFFSFDDTRRGEFGDLLREYQVRANGMLEYEFVDPVEQPARAQQAGIREFGTTVLFMDDRRQQITGTRESDLTTGILRLIQPKAKTAYFTVGHNERRLDGFDVDGYGNIKASMESDNFVVEPLNLLAANAVPEDASVVVIAGPRQKFGESEVQALNEYLDKAGKLMVLVDPKIDTGLAPVFARWNIEVGQNYVVDTDRNAFYRSPFNPVAARFPVHKITEQIPAVLFPSTVAITTPRDSGRGVIINPLGQSTDRSWVEADEAALRDPQLIRFDEGADTRGPLNVAVAIEVTQEQAPPAGSDAPTPPKTRVVIFGTSRLVTNEVFQVPVGNRDYFMNAANWLAEAEELIAIRPKPPDDRKMFLTGAQQNIVLYSTTLFLPLIVLGIGATVWWSRR
jgi:ABC-type uncharacterized transport system involved in gliding motility auxiliary subunit